MWEQDPETGEWFCALDQETIAALKADAETAIAEFDKRYYGPKLVVDNTR